MRIRDIRQIEVNGFIAPLTMSGYMYVDDVHVSCYA
jgi:hypothetical protein